jgi:DnaJ family protein C protein 7
VYSKNKEYSKAVEDFDRSIELNDKYFKAYLRRGDVRMEQGDFDGA